MSSSVFLCVCVCVCVFQREKKSRAVRAPARRTTSQQHRGGERAEDRAAISRHRPQHTSQSQHRHHKPVIHKPQSPQQHYRTKPKKEGNEILDER